MKILAVIPARGGSKGIPKKNIVELGGKPLIAYSIEVAKKSRLVNRMIVTTDDQEIADVAKKYGAEAPFIRPANLAQDDTPPEPVLKHVLEFLVKEENYKPDIIVWLEPPFPFRTAEEVDEAIKLFQADPEADSLRGVCQPFQNPYKMWVLKNKYLQPLIKKEGVTFCSQPRQKTGEVYWQNGHIYLLRYDTIMKKGNFYGEKILPFILAEDKFIDIDSEYNLELARLLLKNKKNK